MSPHSFCEAMIFTEDAFMNIRVRSQYMTGQRPGTHLIGVVSSDPQSKLFDLVIEGGGEQQHLDCWSLRSDSGYHAH